MENLPLESINQSSNWINNNRGVMTTAAAVITICALCAIRSLHADSPQSFPETFQVTTYNTLAPSYAEINGGQWYSHIDPSIMNWEYRQEALIQHIRSLDSDIFCFQEVEPAFFARLQAEMPGYTGVFENVNNKPGEALFFREPFTLTEASHAVASDGRFGQVVELQWGDKKVAILNAHLAWDEQGIKAHQQIQDLFAAGLQPREVDHLIICGDFNVPHDSLAVQYLEGIGFRRAYAGVEPGVTCSVPDAAHEVDFILASQSLEPLWVRPVRPISGRGMLPCAGEPSDHLAKTAIFRGRRAAMDFVKFTYLALH